ncbi:MAG: hypothetical protein ABI647_11270 [Gemmatimonadota bacterium]
MTTPPQPPIQPDPLQFDRAERAGPGLTGTMTCSGCTAPIGDTYFEAGGKVFCPRCAAAVRAATENRGRFGRAVLYGLGGAILGTAIYYAVLAITHYEIGLIAILVGFVVGKAVSLGGGSLGGRRYQVLAVVLTYLSIGATYVPLVIRGLGSKQQPASAADSLARSGPAVPNNGSAADVKPARGIAVGVLALIALAATMPIIAGVSNLPASLIGLLILGFALMQAWRMNQRGNLEVSGPFRVPGVPHDPAPGEPPNG